MLINVEAEDWNKAYAEEAPKLAAKVSLLKRQGTTAEGALVTVAKKGTQLSVVNGYDVRKALGKGAFGEVFLASKNSQQFAIKVLLKSKLKKVRTGRHSSAFDSIKTEIATMKKIAHPNCVHMFDVIIDQDHDEVFLVLEYIEGGPSQRMSDDGKGVPLPERTIWSHMRHLVMGLEYLHMHGIIHRDIKPENLLITSTARSSSGAGVLKICDFGTAAFCEGDANAQKTAGTPAFFSPELCTTDTKGTYDVRVVDLWAVGVTVYMWSCGRAPFQAATTMLLMQDIKDAPEVVKAPPEASAGLGAVIEALMTRDMGKRLTLNQLRLHEWLTDHEKQPLPSQPVMMIEVTAEEIEQAISNRKAIKVGSSAGPSFLGTATDNAASGWTREGVNIIKKRGTAKEAGFYKEIAGSGHLAMHIPIIYSSGAVDEDGDGSVDKTNVTTFGGVTGGEADDVHDIRMQDLVAEMTRPCAMSLILGTRTLTPADLEDKDPQPSAKLLEAAEQIAPGGPTAEERAAGGVTFRRYLELLDSTSSTQSLGFRVDASKTMVDGALDALPLPDNVTLGTLKEEDDLVAAFLAFLQKDKGIAMNIVMKLESLEAALKRSDFVPKTCLIRSTMLIVYDDAARQDKMELKIMNFADSYTAPEGVTVTHEAEWDGTNHEDGYLVGIRSLLKIVKRVVTECA